MALAVKLRPFEEPDLALLSRFAVDRTLSEPYSWFGFRSPDGFRRRWEEDGFLDRSPRFLAVSLDDGTAIGWVTWRENERPGPGVWEIGALIAPDHRGQGAATAAQRLLVDHLFSTTTAHRIWAGTEVDNVAEQRALERCGFRREGTLRGAHFRDGRWQDSVVYGLLRDELAARDRDESGSRSSILDEDMRRVVDEQRLGYVASVCPDGTPNLSPKGTTAVWDDEHLVFAHLHSPQTVANIEAGARVVEINVVDPIRRKGYRFKGPAEVHRDGPVYEAGLRFYDERSGLEAHRVKAVVLVRVDQAAPVVSPAYDDGSSERDVEARILALYGLSRTR